MTTVLYPSMPRADAIELSKHYLKMMIFGVETRPNGFDSDGIMWLVENWLMLVKNFRGPGHVNALGAFWLRRHKLRPVPAGRKRTEHLVISLKQFNHFLNPGEQNLEGVYKLFKELEVQMFELVEDFRGKMEGMNHKDLPRFVQELERVTARVKIRHQ